MAYINGKEILFSPNFHIVSGYNEGFNEGYAKGFNEGEISVLKGSQYMNGKESGTIVSVNDVTPIEHNVGVKLSSDTITDFTGFTVSKIKKNLLPFPYATKGYNANGIRAVVNSDGTITVNGTAKYAAYIHIATEGQGYSLKGKLPVGVKLCVSGSPQYSDYYYIGFRKVGGVNGEVYDAERGKGRTFTLKSGESIDQFYICVEKGTTMENVIFKPQIAVGTDTEYEPYEKPITYAANADGTVEGVKSISPNMTLIPNNNAVSVECEYLRDIDLYIDNLLKSVAMIGGE